MIASLKEGRAVSSRPRVCGRPPSRRPQTVPAPAPPTVAGIDRMDSFHPSTRLQFDGTRIDRTGCSSPPVAGLGGWTSIGIRIGRA